MAIHITRCMIDMCFVALSKIYNPMTLWKMYVCSCHPNCPHNKNHEWVPDQTIYEPYIDESNQTYLQSFFTIDKQSSGGMSARYVD